MQIFARLAIESPQLINPAIRSARISLPSWLTSKLATAMSTSSPHQDSTCEVNNTHLRKSARRIFDAGVQAVLPNKMVKNALQLKGKTLIVNQRQYPVDGNVHIVAFGKAVVGMVRAAEDVLGEEIAGGIASIPAGIQKLFIELNKEYLLPPAGSKVKLIEGAVNNLPDADSLQAAEEVAALARRLTDKDILLVLISGGGSALLPAPAPPLTLGDKLQTIKLLAGRGASIEQLNTVRKNLSTLKGGRLAELASPAQVISLILSDIIGDPLDLIASGPTVADHSSRQDCLQILQGVGLGEEDLPSSVFQCLKKENNEVGKIMPQAEITSRVNNVIIGSNSIAAESAKNCAEELGFSAVSFSCAVEGEAREVARKYVTLATTVSERYHSLKRADADNDNDVNVGVWQQFMEDFGISRSKACEMEDALQAAVRDGKPICLLGAGETVVTIAGSGKGGRNQELALAASIWMKSSSRLQELCHLGYRIILLSAGTDGQDGPTDAAGALAVLKTEQDQSGLDQCGQDPESFLKNNDSYTYYKTLDGGRDLLITGLTGTNVMDLQILLVHPPSQS